MLTGDDENPTYTAIEEHGAWWVIGSLAIVTINLRWESLTGGSGRLRISVPNSLPERASGTADYAGAHVYASSTVPVGSGRLQVTGDRQVQLRNDTTRSWAQASELGPNGEMRMTFLYEPRS